MKWSLFAGLLGELKVVSFVKMLSCHKAAITLIPDLLH